MRVAASGSPGSHPLYVWETGITSAPPVHEKSTECATTNVSISTAGEPDGAGDGDGAGVASGARARTVTLMTGGCS